MKVMQGVPDGKGKAQKIRGNGQKAWIAEGLCIRGLHDTYGGEPGTDCPELPECLPV